MSDKIRSICILLTAALLTFAITGCSGNTNETNATTVTVKIIYDTQLLNSSVTLSDEKPTAQKAVAQICKESDIPFTYSNGMFDGFAGHNSTQTDGWLLYINGTLSQTGAADCIVQNDDLVEFRYVNYNMAFNSSDGGNQ